ncbi:MAG TPA: class I SAM-dependent methyltransferase [Acidimicrobiales bacterium]|jgi:2-polyprenyl-3-methyl-5-hydroxy-6-metoxy-1,4-benzoquinol methylase|nr:class I SAM-dependent methyltransferase [Acidimicrobiales bacterium]
MTDDEIGAYAFKVWNFKQGEIVSLMIHLGDRLGLYQAMSGSGPVTAAELAAQTGLQERWLLEWLRSQAAAGLISTRDGDTFELPPEAAPVLVDETTSSWYAGGAFFGAAAPADVVDGITDAFRTGIGLSYDQLGPSAAHQVERLLGPGTRLALVPVILPALDGVSERLRSGARVADVGCGAGLALLTMAEAYPASEFDGFDPSLHAIEVARHRLAESGVGNARFHVREAADLPEEPTYDFIITFDCLHDMTRPADAFAAIRGALRPDGVWLVKEIRSSPTWSDNLRNPMLAMMYGTSITTCMSSALSEPGGAGLGTLGMHRERAEAMAREAGFTRFQVHDFDDPVNLYYEIRA